MEWARRFLGKHIAANLANLSHLSLKNDPRALQESADSLENLRQDHRLLQDVVSMSAHEWRNYLTRLILHLQLLSTERLGPLTDSQREILTSIRTSLTMMRHIASNQLMTVALEQRSFPLSLRWHDVYASIIKPLPSFLGTLCSDHLIEVDLKPANLMVWADCTLLQIACENLLNNAIKYREPGGRILIAGQVADNFTELSVWNSGPAPSEDQAGDLFQRFVRGHATPAEGSTGLGLYIVHRIIKVHKGQGQIETEPHQWFKVTLRLPTPEG